MSTPTVERTRTTTRRRATEVPAQRHTSGSVNRAYARRAGRQQRLGGAVEEHNEGRSRFVLIIMLMLGVGLVASLWLSTSAAADSYRLGDARQSTRDLTERIETLRSQIDAMQSPPTLARAAGSLGMVQVSDVARLIVGPDGHVTVFGTPKAAVPGPPPAPLVSAPAAAPTAPTSPTSPVAPQGGQVAVPQGGQVAVPQGGQVAVPQTAPANQAQQPAPRQPTQPAPQQASQPAPQQAVPQPTAQPVQPGQQAAQQAPQLQPAQPAQQQAARPGTAAQGAR
jgi:hypothetical protein